jgi:3-oxoadipate enol-lactonase
MTTRDIILKGRHFSYADTAPAEDSFRPVLILGHGYFLDQSIFEGLMDPSILDTWRVITWDARGHGGTPDSETAYDYWDQAGDVLALMDALQVPQAVIGGLSQGGFTALRTALTSPDRVTGLVLWDTEAQACDPDDKVAYQGMFSGLRQLGPVDDILNPLASQLIGEHPSAEGWKQNWRRDWSLALDAAADCLLERDDITGRLAEITCPALLIRGREDVSLPRERMLLMQEQMPQAGELHEIPDAAHTPTLTHPELVVPLLREFLPRCLPRA